MKKWMIFILLIVCLFLVSGAAGCGGGDDKVEVEGIFIGGSSGVEASFMDGKPDDLVYKDQTFEIGINVKNKGEFASRKIITSLFGLNQDSFSLASLDKSMISSVLDGMEVDFPNLEPEEEDIIFEARYKESIRADFKPTIKADVCYLYGGYTVADICLKRDVYAEDESDSCEVASVSSFESSSAPVRITSIEARPSSNNEIKLLFTIENLGNGGVYLNDAFENSCRGQGEKKDKVLVQIESTTLVPVSCSKISDAGVANLVSDRRTVSCKIDTKDLQDVAFSERINFNIYYFYKESLTKSITIKP